MSSLSPVPRYWETSFRSKAIYAGGEVIIPLNSEHSHLLCIIFILVYRRCSLAFELMDTGGRLANISISCDMLTFFFRSSII